MSRGEGPWKRWWWVGIGLALAVGLWLDGDGMLLNLGAVRLLQASSLLSAPSPARAEAADLLLRVADREPSAHWALALLAAGEGEDARRRTHLMALLTAKPGRLPLVRDAFPEDLVLARWAWEQEPHSPVAAFWLARLTAQQDREAALALYQEGLRLDPLASERWVELGMLYRQAGRLEEALAAFRHGCELRDTGGNGCWQAGLLAQEMGRLDLAEEFYARTLEQMPGYTPAATRLQEVTHRE